MSRATLVPRGTESQRLSSVVRAFDLDHSSPDWLLLSVSSAAFVFSGEESSSLISVVLVPDELVWAEVPGAREGTRGEREAAMPAELPTTSAVLAHI